MSLGLRLKAARESRKWSQKEMADAIGILPQTWRVYESGKSVPGGNVLEGLARLGFNVNWLLTGEGERLSSELGHRSPIFEPAPHPGGSMADKFKLIRGGLSYRDFALRFGRILEPDLKKWEVELQSIEEEKIQPDWVLLSCVCHYFGISPSWLIEDEGPMYKKDITQEPKPKRYEDLDENGTARYWEEEQIRFNRVSNIIDEYIAKYRLDPVRDKRGNLTMTLFNIFGDKFCDDREKFLKGTVNSLVRLCIPDEYYANIDEINFYIASAYQALEENDLDDARDRMLKSAKILEQLGRLERGEWSEEMQSAKNEHLDFIHKDAGYGEGLAKLLPIIQSKHSILESDLAKACPDMNPRMISYILFFAAAQGVVERIQKGRTFLVRPGNKAEKG